MCHVVSLAFALIGLLNILPVVGILSSKRLQSLYELPVLAPEVGLLMQHRAVLFGLLGGMLIAASIRTELRAAATIAGLISMLSFCVLVLLSGTSNPSLMKIFWIDSFASVGLAIAFGLHWRFKLGCSVATCTLSRR